MFGEFKNFVEIKEYIDGGPNDRGWVIGYLDVTNDMFTLGESWGEPALQPNEKFIKEVEEKLNIKWCGFYQPYFIDKSEFLRRKREAENELKLFKL